MGHPPGISLFGCQGWLLVTFCLPGRLWLLHAPPLLLYFISTVFGWGRWRGVTRIWLLRSSISLPPLGAFGSFWCLWPFWCPVSFWCFIPFWCTRSFWRFISFWRHRSFWCPISFRRPGSIWCSWSWPWPLWAPWLVWRPATISLSRFRPWPIRISSVLGTFWSEIYRRTTPWSIFVADLKEYLILMQFRYGNFLHLSGC